MNTVPLYFKVALFGPAGPPVPLFRRELHSLLFIPLHPPSGWQSAAVAGWIHTDTHTHTCKALCWILASDYSLTNNFSDSLLKKKISTLESRPAKKPPETNFSVSLKTPRLTGVQLRFTWHQPLALSRQCPAEIKWHSGNRTWCHRSARYHKIRPMLLSLRVFIFRLRTNPGHTTTYFPQISPEVELKNKPVLLLNFFNTHNWLVHVF